MRCGRAVLLLLSLFVAGCATTITPPPRPVDPVRVYVTDYGRHSSLLLRDPAGHVNEYAFGDWGWFALSKTSTWDAARAMLFSGASTLGRRQLDLPDAPDAESPDAESPGPQLGAAPEAIARAVAAESVFLFDASRQDVNALIARLDALFYQHHDTVTWNPESQMWFVKYDGNYSIYHNCNHLTAAWLKSLGCKVRGLAATSRFVLDSSAPAARAAHDGAPAVP